MLATVESEIGTKPRLFHFTVEKYFEMIKIGVIPNGAPYELLDGLVVLKDRAKQGEDPMSNGAEHTFAVLRLAKLDNLLSKFKCHMRHQSPVILSDSQAPEPDGSIVNGTDEDYIKWPPSAKDVHCVIEVADSSLGTDRGSKLGGYAAAGIYQLAIFKPGEAIPFFPGLNERLAVPVDYFISMLP